ncbi:MAG: hypothetical protein OXF20_10635 [Gammaproteobacteria bacterium]|nr:hypothetical protein [Gammaproteobacteria bacterium]
MGKFPIHADRGINACYIFHGHYPEALLEGNLFEILGQGSPTDKAVAAQFDNQPVFWKTKLLQCPQLQQLASSDPEKEMKQLTKLTPPPRKLTALLLLAVLAVPAGAQTITAPGLVGQAACNGPGEVTDIDLGDISVNTMSVSFDRTEIINLYSTLRSRSGDGGPNSFPILAKVYNTRTDSQVGSTVTLASINSGFTALISGSNQLANGLTVNTPYTAVVYTTATGFGEARPFLRRCFMTGGTYTPSNESGQPGFVANTTSGCFSISPLTRLDVRNCLCGRSRLWNDNDQNTAQRRSLGCANAN